MGLKTAAAASNRFSCLLMSVHPSGHNLTLMRTHRGPEDMRDSGTFCTPPLMAHINCGVGNIAHTGQHPAPTRRGVRSMVFAVTNSRGGQRPFVYIPVSCDTIFHRNSQSPIH